MEPNAKLQTQKPTKVPIHYCDKLYTLLDDLQKKTGILKQTGSMPHEKPNYGTAFLKPLIIIKKKNSIKIVLDARHLNSNTDQSTESWPLEPLARQLARANKNYKSAIDLMYAYARATLDDETIKLTGFSHGGKLLAFIREVYGLKGLQNFFTQQMSLFFEDLIRQGSALVYNDDILLMSNSKPHMLQLIKQLYDIAKKENVKKSPEKSFFILLTVKNLSHEIIFNTIKPIQSKIAINKIPSPTKNHLMRFIGSMNFHSKFGGKFQVNVKSPYDFTT